MLQRGFERGENMKDLSVWEKYVVAIENYGQLEAAIWCANLENARKEAKDVRREAESDEERKAVLILKVLRI